MSEADKTAALPCDSLNTSAMGGDDSELKMLEIADVNCDTLLTANDSFCRDVIANVSLEEDEVQQQRGTSKETRRAIENELTASLRREMEMKRSLVSLSHLDVIGKLAVTSSSSSDEGESIEQQQQRGSSSPDEVAGGVDVDDDRALDRAELDSFLAQIERDVRTADTSPRDHPRPKPVHNPRSKRAQAPPLHRNQQQQQQRRQVRAKKAAGSGPPPSAGAAKRLPGAKAVKGSKKEAAKRKGEKADDEVGDMVESPPMIDVHKVRGHLQNLLNPAAEPGSKELDDLIALQTAKHKTSEATDDCDVTASSREATVMRQVRLMIASPPRHNDDVDSDDVTKEAGIVREALERERYRRKHCEREIHDLQKRVLEVRQELAVAEAVEAKKDAMVQQLDKMLFEMLQGWKQHESSLRDQITSLGRENERHLAEKAKLEQTVRGLECDLAKVFEELEGDRQKLVSEEEKHLETKITFQSKAVQIQRAIETRNRAVSKLRKEKELLALELTAHKQRLADAHHDYEKQGMIYCKEELGWKEKLEESERRRETQVDQLKIELEQERERACEAAKRLEEDAERERSEADRMKREWDAKQEEMEKEARDMEERHRIHLNQTLDEERRKIESERDRKEMELVEENKKQVLGLIEAHKRDIQRMKDKQSEEFGVKEASFRRATEEIERSYHHKLEERTAVIREQMKARMQNLFRAHYDQTLKAMGDSPLGGENESVSRSFSNTKHVMISIPSTTTSPTTTNNNNNKITSSSINTSILQQPFFNNASLRPVPQASEARNLESDVPQPGTDARTGSQTVTTTAAAASAKTSRKFSAVDALIEEKSKNILSNLDQKLLELRSTTTNLYDRSFNSDLRKTNEPPSCSSPPTTTTATKTASEELTATPTLTTEQAEYTTATSAKEEENEEEVERKKRLEHYVQRLLNLRPAHDGSAAVGIDASEPGRQSTSPLVQSHRVSSSSEGTSNNTSSEQMTFHRVIQACDRPFVLRTNHHDDDNSHHKVKFAQSASLLTSRDLAGDDDDEDEEDCGGFRIRTKLDLQR